MSECAGDEERWKGGRYRTRSRVEERWGQAGGTRTERASTSGLKGGRYPALRMGDRLKPDSENGIFPALSL